MPKPPSPPKPPPTPDKGKPPSRDDKTDKGGPVRTQMKGERPGDDLGYDPKIIPVEEIE
jgi:hypothetical protein